MSQYSETIGSFTRTGNYPLESHYIFSSEAALKEFYSDPLNQTTLHKGLLKVIEDDGTGNQALYWVVKKQGSDELEFTKLISNLTSDNIQTQLEEFLQKLDKEIQDRKLADQALWGTTDPTNIPDDLNSIQDLANTITEFKNNIEELDIIKEQLQILEQIQNFLGEYIDSNTLEGVLNDLLNKIQGDITPSEEFQTLRGIEEFVRTLSQYVKDRTNNLQTELDQTQVGIGLSQDGSFSPDKETNYLQKATSVMNALKILDSLIKSTSNPIVWNNVV